MSESWQQPQGGYSDQPQADAAQGLASAAAAFSRSVQDATERFGAAGAQLVAMSQELSSAIAEAKAAAARAEEAQQGADAARARAEAAQADMQRDHGIVSNLVKELQDRIAALAVLARPIAMEPAAAEPAAQEQAAAESGSAGETPDTLSSQVEGDVPEQAGSSEPEPQTYGSGYGGQSWGSRSW
jgi:hypothetical protein